MTVDHAQVSLSEHEVNNPLKALLVLFFANKTQEQQQEYCAAIRHFLHLNFKKLLQRHQMNHEMIALLKGVGQDEYASRLAQGTSHFGFFDLWLFCQEFQVNVWIWIPGHPKPCIFSASKPPQGQSLPISALNVSSHCHIALRDAAPLFSAVIFNNHRRSNRIKASRNEHALNQNRDAPAPNQNRNPDSNKKRDRSQMN
eukprot:TRINITY_DN20624_c0_g1_i8.p1 TRINITY_DN20624_c0_g1~~TRINITY_DN20624_c0_g1_i8.p1  ORF type:complete len:218 (-),score=45.24 TRINITY_DN20624_c0_g1_i8:109-705(-)